MAETATHKGSVALKPLDAAIDRVFSILCMIAAFAGSTVTAINFARGHMGFVTTAFALVAIGTCLSAPFAIKRFAGLRHVIMTVVMLVNALVLYGFAIYYGLLIASSSIFLLLLIPAGTYIFGRKVGVVVTLATLATYSFLYFAYHHGSPPLVFGPRPVNWSVVFIAMSTCAIFLFLSSYFFRQHMMAAITEAEMQRQRAEASANAKSHFLANMSHEIRTPMNGILGMIDIVLQSKIDGEQRANLEVVHSSAKTLIRVLSDILDLSKLESGMMTIDPAPADPAAIVTRAARLFKAAAQNKGLTIDTAGEEQLPPLLLIDEDRLVQILSNLIANAVKFTDEGGLTLFCSYSRGRLEIRVSDTGCGMTEDFIPHLFTRFKQEASDAAAEGTGLGLAICQQLAHQMGGRIFVESQLGEGTTFTLNIAAPLVTNGDARTEAENTPDLPPNPAAQGLSVLIAEDNEVNQRVAVAFLEGLGHRCTTVEDGQMAYIAVVTGDFDAVFMDLDMPGTDGIEGTRMIRALPDRKGSIPIIMLTAHIEEAYLERCLSAGADTILHKPVKQTKLQAALDKLCDKPAKAARAAS
jgi:signal transduction histidine kinase/ActR/RegA family two-component response regulator